VASQNSNRKVQFRDQTTGRGDYRSSDERYPHPSGDGNDRSPRGRDNRRNDDQQSRSNGQDRPPRYGIGQGTQGYQNNNRDQRPSWRSSSADSQNQQSFQNQASTSRGYEANSGRPNYRPLPGNWEGRPSGPTLAYPFRGTGNCWTCGQEGCHSRYHRDQPNAQPSNVTTRPGQDVGRSPRFPNYGESGCWICGSQEHWTRQHNDRGQMVVEDQTSGPTSQSNCQRGPRQGDRTPPSFPPCPSSQ